jgi:hypothetical protein
MKRKPDAPWDHTVHEERKQAKVDKKSKELIAQIYDALDVDPAEIELKDGEYFKIVNVSGQVVYGTRSPTRAAIPKFKAPRGGIRFGPPPQHLESCACDECTGTEDDE